MGTYDEYGSVQLKVGPCEMLDYDVGDKADIPDGVYVGHDGVVVIKDGIFIAEFSHLVTTWGDIVKPVTVLAPFDVVSHIAADFAARKWAEEPSSNLPTLMDNATL